MSSTFANSGTYVGAATAAGVALAKETDWNSTDSQKATIKRVGINAGIAGLGYLAVSSFIDQGIGAMMMLSYVVGQGVAFGYNKMSDSSFSPMSLLKHRFAETSTPQIREDKNQGARPVAPQFTRRAVSQQSDQTAQPSTPAVEQDNHPSADRPTAPRRVTFRR